MKKGSEMPNVLTNGEDGRWHIFLYCLQRKKLCHKYFAMVDDGDSGDGNELLILSFFERDGTLK